MPEYQPIANLRGPSAYDLAVNDGFNGSESDWLDVIQGNPVVITSSQEYDIDEMKYPAVYRVNYNATAEALGLPVSLTGHLEVQRMTDTLYIQRYTARYIEGSPSRVFIRGMNRDREYLPYWDEVTSHAGGAPYEQIKDLAMRDGWLAVYDPTDPTTTLVDEGRVRVIQDGMGNLGSITNDGSNAPTHRPGEFGQLDGMGGDSEGSSIRGAYGGLVEQPTTAMILARDSKPRVDASSERRWLFDNHTTGYRQGFFARPHGGSSSEDSAATWRTATSIDSVPDDVRHDTRPHLFRATFADRFNGDSPITIDENFGTVTRGDSSTSGLTLGEDRTGSNQWQGTWGVFLLYQGEIPQDKVNRMSRLLMSLAGIDYAAPQIEPPVQIYSEDEHGNSTFAYGNPNRVEDLSGGIASVTKVMTLWAARQNLTDSEMSDQVEIVEEDLEVSTRLELGDLVTYRDLFLLTAVPSDNGAPRAVARSIGEKLLAAEGESGSGRERFYEEMNSEANRLGYSGASFSHPSFDGRISPRDLVDLFRRTMADPELRSAHSARTATVSMSGPNSRELNISHTADGTAILIPGFVGAKTGTRSGYGHVVAVWQHPDGSEHCTVVLYSTSSPGTARYVALRKAISHIVADRPPHIAGY